MKLKFAFMSFTLCTASLMPSHSYAQNDLFDWLELTWLHNKVLDFHKKNSEKLEKTQAAKNAASASVSVNSTALSADSSKNLQSIPIDTTQIKHAVVMQAPQVLVTQASVAQGTVNPLIVLAPVETANAKLNEKYLSPEELKQLRHQLKQQR
jgi:hypothetical protein